MVLTHHGFVIYITVSKTRTFSTTWSVDIVPSIPSLAVTQPSQPSILKFSHGTWTLHQIGIENGAFGTVLNPSIDRIKVEKCHWMTSHFKPRLWGEQRSQDQVFLQKNEYNTLHRHMFVIFLLLYRISCVTLELTSWYKQQSVCLLLPVGVFHCPCQPHNFRLQVERLHSAVDAASGERFSGSVVSFAITTGLIYSNQGAVDAETVSMIQVDAFSHLKKGMMISPKKYQTNGSTP